MAEGFAVLPEVQELAVIPTIPGRLLQIRLQKGAKRGA
jgi:hypothetical protein